MSAAAGPTARAATARAATARTATARAATASVAALLLILSDPAFAGDPSPADPPSPCSAPEYRQFDFWIGEWEVRNPDGTLAGTNRVERILGGCVLQENWKGKGGMTGTSFNTYDPGDRRWHQTWVDDRGTLLVLAGEWKDGAMTLAGETAARGANKAANHRITWTPLADGRLTQLWESSEDGGKTWSIVFAGTYSRKR